MHGLQVVHGNLKGVCRILLHPRHSDFVFDTSLYLKANIYIRNFHACIADFGTTTIARTDPLFGTHRGSTPSLISFAVGALCWMSPELLDPQKFNAPDPRPTKESDRFALGMVIYEVCAHKVLLLRRAHDGIGALWKYPVRWLGWRKDQRCNIERNSTSQAEGGGTPWTFRRSVGHGSAVLG